jgi:RNA-directed DNA polymerase
LREKTSARWGWLPLPDLIEILNRHLLGWGNYFDFGYPRHAFRRINTYVRHRLWRQLRRRSQRRYRQADGQTLYRHLEAAGLIRL